MPRKIKEFLVDSPEVVKKQLLSWSQTYEEVVWLDSNEYPQQHTTYDALLAVEAMTSIASDCENAFDRLDEYQRLTQDWLFGYLGYDLKNDVEALRSDNHDGVQFKDLVFFQPKKVFLLKENRLEVQYMNVVADELSADMEAIFNTSTEFKQTKEETPKIRLRIHKDAYIEKVERMLAHIYRGDIYEANFCQEFYAEESRIDPLKTYHHLNSISKPPFACYLRWQQQYLLSASPERYLRKTGTEIVSQPIKGTAKRSRDYEEDQSLRNALENDPKERSENVMIVDLVRNDLSRTAVKGSVAVEELCKVYTFDQVHQMISTVVSQVEAETKPVNILRTTFPMGSMTGAPKVSAMRIIEALEESKRGLYSGSVGYFTPTGDFDFNVVIRSILYNEAKRYVSYSVGSAITAKSIPHKEYEECLVKAKAMREVLEA